MESVSRACPSCGADVASRFPRCGQCGAIIDERHAVREFQRVVTVVTSDLKGSTALGERLDPESLREVMTTYVDEMKAVFEAHGGTVEKIIGDAIVAVFGLPTARDDDAIRAVEAAAESQRILTSLNDRLEARWGVRLTVRTGVATGEIVVGDAGLGQHVLTGPTMVIATTMEQNAPSQEVLLAASTYHAVRDAVQVEELGPFSPKGGGPEIQSYRLVSVADRPEPEAPPDTTGRLCQTCGEENPEAAKFCGMCGERLASRLAARDTRKTVTIVFADPKPTTADGSEASPEALRDVMSRYFAGMQQALDRHGATVEKFIGDAVMAVFGLPIRHEDDALRAVRAARDMQAALPALNQAFGAEYGIALGNHIGVNTGEVVAGDASLGQRLVTGDTVNVAARLEQSASDHEILLGDLTYRLVRDAVTVEEVEPLTLKGKSEPVPAYRLVAVSDTSEGFQRRSDTPMVGREDEMVALREIFAQAGAERTCRMATVIGDAGVGKSRLIAEFTAERGEGATVIRGRCLPYGDGITFWPLREAVSDAAGIGPDDSVEVAQAKLRAQVPEDDIRERLASVIGMSEQPFPVPEVFWGARRFLEGLARDRPVVMVVDDIHWAEATFLELITNLVETVKSAPVLLLCTSRHDLLDRQPDWAAADGALRIVLNPLSDADAGRVVEALLGGTGLDEEVRGRIVQAAAGNPLFVEQLLSMLIDDGTLRREGEEWVRVGDVSRLQVPPTIEALLTARLDLLEPDERGVIEPASVIGQNFAVAAVADLAAPAITPDVPDHLLELSRKQLVAPSTTDEAEDAAYRFHHLLVRDAAYGGLLKRSRAELHERFVTWAEGFNAAHGVDNREFEEIHGYHLEQAYRYLTELGTVDEHALAIGIKGSQKLASAGRRAMARGDMPAAASLLRRAAATRLEHDRERLALLVLLGEVLTEVGAFDEARSVLGEASEAAAAIGATLIGAKASLVDLYLDLYGGNVTDGGAWTARTKAATQSAIETFREGGDREGETFAWRLRQIMFGAATQMAASADAASHVIELAGTTGDLRSEIRGASWYAMAAVYGPTPAPEARDRIEELVGRAGGDQLAAAVMNLLLAQTCAMTGDLDHARSLYRQSKLKLDELRAGRQAASTSTDSARVEFMAGDVPAAAELLQRDYDALSRIGERYILATVAGLLARARQLLGDRVAAQDAVMAAESLSAEDDLDAQAIWRGVKARLLADGGSFTEARALAAEAVELRRQSDTPLLLAEALMDAAAVEERAGDRTKQVALLGEARDLAHQKGDIVTEAAIRQQLG